MTQPPWMALAWADLGLHEIPGRANNARITDYFARIGHRAVQDDETAWCAAFVGACLERSNLVSTRSLAARSYLTWGRASEPEPGCITILSRGDDPALGHVGFLVGLTTDKIVLLGGNQSDSVSVAAFDRSRLLACRLPSAQPMPLPATAPALMPDQTDAFRRALAKVLEFEGGWTDDPFDAGGPTNKGITLGVYARERGIRLDATTLPELKAGLRDIPSAMVARIYLERYWRPSHAADLPAGLAFLHFDTAVNQGLGTAARLLQEALGVDVDGEIGPLTLSAAHVKPAEIALSRYADLRRRRYRGLAQFWRFGRGWLRRVDGALEWARADAAHSARIISHPQSPQETKPMTKNDGTNEGFPGAIATAPVKWWGQSMTLWGTLLTGLSTVAPAIFFAFGIDVSADLIEQAGRDLMACAQAAGGLIGTILTIAGRVRSTTRLERVSLNVRL